MSDINPERLLATFLDLVQIDSPSGFEAQVAAYCRKALEEAGCFVVIDDSAVITKSTTGNLFATLPGVGTDAARTKPLYLSAHMDTVSPGTGIVPVLEDGYIRSDGTTVLGGDDKVGVAAILEVIRCLTEGERRKRARPEIRVLLTVQEERSLVGAKAMDRGLLADSEGALCFVLDAAGKPGVIVNGAPYQYSYTATYTGLSAHAGVAPETGISAIRAAAKAVAALPQGKLDEMSTTNVGTIQGGTANNIVASECRVTGELRSHSEQRLLEHLARIEHILTEATEDDGSGAGSAELSISWEVNYEGFLSPEDSPEVQRAFSAAEKLGLEPCIEISNGGADTNILVSYGLAAVSLGTGMDCVHTTQERLAREDLENLARLTLGIIEEGRGV